MPDRKRLSEPEILDQLRDLGGWEYKNERLHREYKFADFIQAWAFMTGCAITAQVLNHHPNWSNVYSKVEIELFTHDAGGVTALDLESARRYEALAAGFHAS